MVDNNEDYYVKQKREGKVSCEDHLLHLPQVALGAEPQRVENAVPHWPQFGRNLSVPQ